MNNTCLIYEYDIPGDIITTWTAFDLGEVFEPNVEGDLEAQSLQQGQEEDGHGRAKAASGNG